MVGKAGEWIGQWVDVVGVLDGVLRRRRNILGSSLWKRLIGQVSEQLETIRTLEHILEGAKRTGGALATTKLLTAAMVTNSRETRSLQAMVDDRGWLRVGWMHNREAKSGEHSI